MLKKIFRGKKQKSELSKADKNEDNLLEEKDKNSDDLLPVNDDQVRIQCTGVSPDDGALLVGFFVSNGLNRKVKFDNLPLVLMDLEGQVLARQSFDGEIIGEIAGGTSKACVVRFLSDNVYCKDIPVECLIHFDLPAKHTESNKMQYQVLPENITETQRLELEHILTELPSMKPGEVNFQPLEAQITNQGDLITTVIIRNYSDKIINVKQLPLAVFDAQREELARGLFEVKDLTIEPFKAVLWTFNFGSLLLDKYIDLSSWHINVLQEHNKQCSAQGFPGGQPLTGV